jgi:oligosaccharide reducing-end xylanase
MKKIIFLVTLITLCFSLVGFSNDDSVKDVNDPRGKMKPWDKGAWETGKYRNVFLEAGYKQEDIEAKLAKAYSDLFEGPNRVYFEVGDDMAYVTDIKNRDARTEGLSYGLMVAVQLNKKEVFESCGDGQSNTCSIRKVPARPILPGPSIRRPADRIPPVPLLTVNFIL